jgi:hypothetical protein
LTQPTHFDRIEQRVNFMRLKAFNAFNEFRNHPEFPSLCSEYIYMNQSVARATVPMMEEVVRCSEQLPNDPISAPLIKYMKQHIAEETDHDEWYIDDLAVLGFSRENVVKCIPSPNTAAMVGSVYYWLKHYHPVAFLGYMGSIETYPSSEKFVKEMIKDSNLPDQAFDTTLMHARIDITHGQDIKNLINNLPLTEQHLKIIEMTAFQTFRYSALMLDDICKSAPKSLATTF